MPGGSNSCVVRPALSFGIASLASGVIVVQMKRMEGVSPVLPYAYLTALAVAGVAGCFFPCFVFALGGRSDRSSHRGALPHVNHGRHVRQCSSRTGSHSQLFARPCKQCPPTKRATACDPRTPPSVRHMNCPVSNRKKGEGHEYNDVARLDRGDVCSARRWRFLLEPRPQINWHRARDRDARRANAKLRRRDSATRGPIRTVATPSLPPDAPIQQRLSESPFGRASQRHSQPKERTDG